ESARGVAAGQGRPAGPDPGAHRPAAGDLADRARRAAGRGRRGGHPGHALPGPGRARRGEDAPCRRRRPGVPASPRGHGRGPAALPAACGDGRALAGDEAVPTAVGAADRCGGQCQPGGPAHPAGRRALPRLGVGPVGADGGHRHDRRRRHGAGGLPGRHRGRRPGRAAARAVPASAAGAGRPRSGPGLGGRDRGRRRGASTRTTTTGRHPGL
ncbi:MAG: Arginine pathway regulatory protein ArgR, repressor of arg regulon, partial [uncultured Corynebacteriales bacterium]